MKKIGKLLAAILSLALLLQLAAFPAVAVEVGEAVDGIAALADGSVIASGYCGGEGDGTNLSWTLTENGTLTISGNGEMQNYNYNTPWRDYTSTISSVIFKGNVTSIGDGAFDSCQQLMSVAISNSITSIGKEAFKYCDGLTNILVDNENSTYCSVDGVLFSKDMAKLVRFPNGKGGGAYIIPDNVEIIEEKAFYECRGITSIEVSKSVKNISADTFALCYDLLEILVDGDNSSYRSVGGVLFSKDMSVIICYPVGLEGGKVLHEYIIPTGVTTIGKWAFENSNVTSVIIPDSVTNIDDYAFNNCSNLGAGAFVVGSFAIPNSVMRIGEGAFYGCNRMKSINIPNSVTSIGDRAFGNCYELASITIPDSVTSMGSYVFSADCRSLTDIYCVADSKPIGWSGSWHGFGSAVIHWGWEGLPENIIASGHCGGDGNGDNLSWTLTDDGMLTISGDGRMKEFFNSPWYDHSPTINTVVFEGKVTNISQYAFKGCKNLKTIVIPESVTSIGYEAFRACYSLTALVIPNGVTSIGRLAFYDCENLREINIPDGITSIEYSVFAYCKSLESIIIPDSVTSIEKEAFTRCESLKSISIPYGVTSIREHTFDGCWELASVILPKSVTSIGYKAFADCTSLTSIKISKSVTNISDRAFSYCTSLTDIYCEAESKPSGWGSEYGDWNDGCSATVHWGYKLYGDLDGNGEVDESEAVEILGIVKGITAINQQYLQAADFNKDGRIDIRDFNYIYNIIMQK